MEASEALWDLREDQVTVRDQGRSGSSFPRPLSQYLARDVALHLISPKSLRTLTIVESEILSIDSIVAGMRSLRVLKTRARNDIIPVSGLPPEMLSQVFLACLDDIDGTFPTHRPTTAPLILGRVCHTWRVVAWSLPRLWTTVHCVISSNVRRAQTQVEILLGWLRRAKGLPLTIKITFEDEASMTSTHCSLKFADILVIFCKQWKHADLVIPRSWLVNLRLLQLDALQTLHIRPLKFSSVRHNHPLTGFFAPNLVSLSYERYILRSICIPWTNITKATITMPSLDEVLHFLSRCRSLEEFCVIDLLPDGQFYPIAPITHHILLRLSINSKTRLDEAFQPPEQLLDLVTMPFIQEVTLTLLHYSYSQPLAAIVEVIKRSGCPLKRVEVYGVSISEADIIEFLTYAKPVISMINYLQPEPI